MEEEIQLLQTLQQEEVVLPLILETGLIAE